MKQIFLDNQPTPFYITENGQLFREDTGNWYKPFENGGYLSYHLKWKNKTYPRRAHRLVAEAYLPNPENKPFVHHKDHNRLNNNVDNLEWTTIQENNEDKKSRVNQSSVTLNIDLNKEEWKQYLDTEFYVSNMGRVKNIRTGNYLKGNIRENGYLRVGLRHNGKLQSFNVHNLVWLVWKGKQEHVIDHINGDKLDNRLCNLQDITQSENELKANHGQKPIYNTLEKDGEIIKIFQSQRRAAIYYNINSGSINSALHNGWRAGGYYWFFLENKDYV